MVSELSGVQFGLKSLDWFQKQMSVKYEFYLKSRVWFQTKFHNINFEIAKFSRSDTGFFSRCVQMFCWSISVLVWRKLQKLFFIFLKFDWLLLVVVF